MDEQQRKRQEEVALFRYGAIADLVHLEPGTAGLYKRIKDKAKQLGPVPYSRKNQVAAETIRHWLKLYRKGGFDALRPKMRADSGKARRIPLPIVDRLITLKSTNPTWTIKQVIAKAREYPEVGQEHPLPFSTVHRLLQRQGLMDKNRGPKKDRRHFAFAKAGQLWMSDVMHGPTVFVERRRKRKTYLIAFLDDATRVVPFAAFALAENTTAFLPVLKQALMRRGIPERLYVDNGAAYRSKHLALVCARLGITLIHTRPYDAPAKGKQERWFRTVRMQLLPVLGDKDLDSLEALNRRLWAWVETEYHLNPHRGLDGQCPFDRWAQVSSDVRYAGPQIDLDELFLFEARRKVRNDRTISLNGTLYEAEAHLVGSTVTLRYDPHAPTGRPIQVWLNGDRQKDATVVDAYQNCFVRRNSDDRNRLDSEGPTPTPPKGLRLADLSDDE
jgi:transposase InsO family protein